MPGGPLIVVCGRPGVGKTTVSRELAALLPAAHLRIDVIEAAIVRSGLGRHPLGPVGYDIAHGIAATTLAAGVAVVADAVSPVPEARAGEGWRRGPRPRFSSSSSVCRTRVSTAVASRSGVPTSRV